MDEQMESLSSILGDTPFSTGAAQAEPTPPVVEPKVEEPKVDTEKTEAARDDAGRFAPKTDPKPEDKPALKPADVAAIIDERRKRQEAESKLREFQAAKPKTDFFENPDQALDERLSEKMAPLQEKLFKLSVKAAKAGRDDYDEVVSAFAEAAEKDPELWKSFRGSDDPGEYAYGVGKQIKELGDVGGDITLYRAKVQGEMKAELDKRDEQIKLLTAQLEGKQKSQQELDAVPRSLNSKSSGAQPSLTDADPEDITQIVRFKG